MAIFNFTVDQKGDYAELSKQAQEYIPVSNVFAGKSIIGPVREAIQKQVYKAIGRDFYTEIDTNTNQYPADLIDMIKRAVFNLAFAKYTNSGGVQITNVGIVETKNGAQEPARLERIANLRNDIFETAIREIDEIIAFIESELLNQNEAAKYQKYVAFVGYTERAKLLISSAIEFNHFFPINESGVVYNTLQSEIRFQQELVLKPILHGIFPILKTDEKAKILLDTYVKPALAHLSIGNSIMKLTAILGLNGTINIFDNTANNYAKTYKTAPTDLLKEYEENVKNRGNELIKLMINHIQNNPADFPAYPHAEPEGFELEDHTNHNHPRVFVM